MPAGKRQNFKEAGAGGGEVISADSVDFTMDGGYLGWDTSKRGEVIVGRIPAGSLAKGSIIKVEGIVELAAQATGDFDFSVKFGSLIIPAMASKQEPPVGSTYAPFHCYLFVSAMNGNLAVTRIAGTLQSMIIGDDYPRNNSAVYAGGTLDMRQSHDISLVFTTNTVTKMDIGIPVVLSMRLC